MGSNNYAGIWWKPWSLWMFIHIVIWFARKVMILLFLGTHHVFTDWGDKPFLKTCSILVTSRGHELIGRKTNLTLPARTLLLNPNYNFYARTRPDSDFFIISSSKSRNHIKPCKHPNIHKDVRPQTVSKVTNATTVNTQRTFASHTHRHTYIQTDTRWAISFVAAGWYFISDQLAMSGDIYAKQLKF